LVPGPDLDALDAMLDVYDTLRSPVPWTCAELAAAAFALYRGRGGAKSKPMSDFCIGAHAAVANLSLLTRDASPYKSFPRLAVVAPRVPPSIRLAREGPAPDRTASRT
jgi:predicted nucleic acid-binding protein